MKRRQFLKRIAYASAITAVAPALSYDSEPVVLKKDYTPPPGTYIAGCDPVGQEVQIFKNQLHVIRPPRDYIPSPDGSVERLGGNPHQAEMELKYLLGETL